MFQTSLLWFSAREEEIPGSRTTALDLEYGSAHSDLLDLSDDEVVDFDVFRMICYAVAISAYGLDAVKVSEKQRSKKYKHKRKGERINE